MLILFLQIEGFYGELTFWKCSIKRYYLPQLFYELKILGRFFLDGKSLQVFYVFLLDVFLGLLRYLQTDLPLLHLPSKPSFIFHLIISFPFHLIQLNQSSSHVKVLLKLHLWSFMFIESPGYLSVWMPYTHTHTHKYTSIFSMKIHELQFVFFCLHLNDYVYMRLTEWVCVPKGCVVVVIFLYIKLSAMWT